MGSTEKRTYRKPSLVEYGKLEEITRGSGWDFIDFLNGKVNDDGNFWTPGKGPQTST